MGRERQKLKKRSSISTVRRKPKSKKLHLAHPLIAANYDRSQTLTQNYRRLGLTAKLNKTTGGIDKTSLGAELRERGPQSGVDQLHIAASTRRKERIEVAEAKVERDAATGNIVRVVESSTIDERLGNRKPLDDPLNSLDSDSEDGMWNAHIDTTVADSRAPSSATGIVEQLEADARKPVAKYKRKQPEGERVFVEELVRKYGDDYGKMARDMSINYMQRSEGDIKRRIKRWRDNGGTLG